MRGIINSLVQILQQQQFHGFQHFPTEPDLIPSSSISLYSLTSHSSRSTTPDFYPPREEPADAFPDDPGSKSSRYPKKTYSDKPRTIKKSASISATPLKPSTTSKRTRGIKTTTPLSTTTPSESTHSSSFASSTPSHFSDSVSQPNSTTSPQLRVQSDQGLQVVREEH